MSLIFTATYQKEKFQVEVTRDGDLIFLDHDIAYDETIVALGGEESMALLLSNKWDDDKLSVIDFNLQMDIEHRLRLLRDYHDRVLKICQLSGAPISDCVNLKFRLSSAYDNSANISSVLYLLHSATWSAAHYLSPNIQSTSAYSYGLDSYIIKELDWIFRRFMDAMESLERGEDWPPLEATP